MNAAPADLDSAMARRKLHGLFMHDRPALRADDTLRTAGDRMRALHAEAWPVVKKEDRTLLGMIDRPNPDWRAQGHGHDPELSYVSECVNPDLSSHCFDDDDCAAALRLMLERHLHYMPVTDHELHLIGIVSLEEVLDALFAHEDDPQKSLP